MSNKSIEEVNEALRRFVERMQWLLPEWRRDEPASAAAVRAVLAEWDGEIVPHLPWLRASGNDEGLDALLAMIEKARARVRIAFLLAHRDLLAFWCNWRLKELALGIPARLRKLEAEADPAVMEMLPKGYRTLLGRDYEPEEHFRRMMTEADESEKRWKAGLKQMQTIWPQEWTLEVEARFLAGSVEAHMAWQAELNEELREIQRTHPELRAEAE